VLEEEVTAFIGAERYVRSIERCDQRNGSYERELGTGRWRDQIARMGHAPGIQDAVVYPVSTAPGRVQARGGLPVEAFT